MKTSALHANANVWLLLLILIASTLYQSELGGPGTIYNPAMIAIAGLFLMLNFRLSPVLLAVFGIPIVFLLFSIMANVATVTNGGLRSALATGLSFLLLSLAPVPLNARLLRRLVLIYLLVILAFSIWTALANIRTGEVFGGNPNFNINANAAALFLTACLILALAFTHGRIQLLLALGFFALAVSTTSRAGLLVGTLLLVFYVFVSRRFVGLPVWSNPFIGRRWLWVGALASVPAIVEAVRPGSLEFLLIRLKMTGFGTAGAVPGTGRNVIWSDALGASQHSVGTLLFGYGPASASSVIGGGTHSSYVEAFTSLGWPFMISAVFSMAILVAFHARRGETDFTIYAVAIALYGATEAVLFISIGNIWFILLLLSIYYRSISSEKTDDTTIAARHS